MSRSATFVPADGCCPLCANGELVFTRRAIDGVIVECLECMTGYLCPRDLTTSSIIRMESGLEVSTPASLREIHHAGLADLVVHRGEASGDRSGGWNPQSSRRDGP